MQYRVSQDYFDVTFVDAENEKEAIKKAKKAFSKKNFHITAITRPTCAGTWKNGCKNLVDWPCGGRFDSECSPCRYEREQDRINSPG